MKMFSVTSNSVNPLFHITLVPLNLIRTIDDCESVLVSSMLMKNLYFSVKYLMIMHQRGIRWLSIQLLSVGRFCSL